MLPFLTKRPTEAAGADAPPRSGGIDAVRDDAVPTHLHSGDPSPWQPPAGQASSPDAQRTETERVLVCQDRTPRAPRLADLLGVHMPPLGQVLAIWDPHCLWPVDLLGRLSDVHGGTSGSTRLRQGTQAHAFAQVHHWHGPVSGGYLAVIHLQGRDDGSLSAPIGLSLLEHAQAAAIVTGSGNDRDLPLKADAFCRQAAWRGPLVQLLSIQGKHARADRLRRLPWPRSFKTRVVPYTPSRERPWLAECLRQIDPDFILATPVPALDEPLSWADSPSMRDPAPAIEPSTPACSHPIGTMPVAAALQTALIVHPATPFREGEARHNEPTEGDGSDPAPTHEALHESLHCAHLCFGFHGVAVVTPASGLLVSSSGDLPTVQAAALALEGFWSQPVDDVKELSVRRGSMHVLAAAVPRRTGWWLVGVSEVGQAELSQLRWQLQVAANTLAP